MHSNLTIMSMVKIMTTIKTTIVMMIDDDNDDDASRTAYTVLSLNAMTNVLCVFVHSVKNVWRNCLCVKKI